MNRDTHYCGPMTEELNRICDEYSKRYVLDPDEYDELDCSHMTYEEFVGYIKYCLKHNCEMVDIL